MVLRSHGSVGLNVVYKLDFQPERTKHCLNSGSVIWLRSFQFTRSMFRQLKYAMPFMERYQDYIYLISGQCEYVDVDLEMVGSLAF